MSKSKTVYGLVCPVDGLIRYVGITSQGLRSRLRHHWGCRNEHVCREWFQHLERRGLFPDAIPLKENASLEDESDQWGRLILEGHPVMNSIPKHLKFGAGALVQFKPAAYIPDFNNPSRLHDPLPASAWNKSGSNWHTKKEWARRYPDRANAQRYRHRRKKRAAYNAYQRQYMAARRAVLKARRMDEAAGYGEV